METVEAGDVPVITSKYKFEVSKNTKGFNYTISIRGDIIKEVQDDTVILQEWAEEKYGK